jgi:8-oxo-dGTP pyrophosphatase MutT (NUDIX family)
VVENEKGEILLGWRETFGGWNLFGGSMELNESITETLHREILEETGHPVKDAIFFGLATAPRHEVRYAHGDIVQPVSALFVVHLADGAEVVLDEEHTKAGWFALGALPQPLAAGTVAALELLRAYKATGQIQID